MRAEIANLDEPSRQRVIVVVQIWDEPKAAEIEMLKENSDFNFPKIHFLEHLSEHITGYGYFRQYSTYLRGPTRNR